MNAPVTKGMDVPKTDLGGADMTLSPLSPEAVAQMVADREAGTPGPWREAQTWRPPIGNGPHNDMVNGNIFWGYSISGSDENGGHIYPTLAAVHNFPDHVHANARRIARVPDMEATIIAQAATPPASVVEAMERALRDMRSQFSPFPREDTEGWREEHEACEAADTALADLTAWRDAQ